MYILNVKPLKYLSVNHSLYYHRCFDMQCILKSVGKECLSMSLACNIVEEDDSWWCRDQVRFTCQSPADWRSCSASPSWEAACYVSVHSPDWLERECCLLRHQDLFLESPPYSWHVRSLLVRFEALGLEDVPWGEGQEGVMLAHSQKTSLEGRVAGRQYFAWRIDLIGV